jgi:hypothetical protein
LPNRNFEIKKKLGIYYHAACRHGRHREPIIDIHTGCFILIQYAKYEAASFGYSQVGLDEKLVAR